MQNFSGRGVGEGMETKPSGWGEVYQACEQFMKYAKFYCCFSFLSSCPLLLRNDFPYLVLPKKVASFFNKISVKTDNFNVFCVVFKWHKIM